MPSAVNIASPTGTILSYGGTTAPSGWLLCDGASLLRTDFPALFSSIGTNFGAVDGTHFNIPDLRGQFIRGVSGASTNDPDKATRTVPTGSTNGANDVGSSQADQLKSHAHTFSGSLASSGTGGNFFSGNSAHNIDPATSSVGGNETRPTNIYANFIIKY